MGVEGNRGEPQGTETDGSRGKHEGRKGDPWGPGPGSRGTEGNWGRGGKDRAQLERLCIFRNYEMAPGRNVLEVRGVVRKTWGQF